MLDCGDGKAGREMLSYLCLCLVLHGFQFIHAFSTFTLMTTVEMSAKFFQFQIVNRELSALDHLATA